MSTFNRVLSALLALALFLGGLLVAIECVLAALGRPGWVIPRQQWTSALTSQAWDQTLVRLIAAGAIVVGLLLLVAALRRGAPGTIALPTTTDGVDVRAQRRGLERTVASAARRTDGVTSAHATATRRAMKVTAATSLRDAGDLQPAVRRAVDARLGELGLDGQLRSKISLEKKGSR